MVGSQIAPSYRERQTEGAGLAARWTLDRSEDLEFLRKDVEDKPGLLRSTINVDIGRTEGWGSLHGYEATDKSK